LAKTSISAPPESPRLQVKIQHRIGALAINVDFSLTQPWTILFGPSGSGKSTILRTIAGLVRSDSSYIAWTLERFTQNHPQGVTVLFTIVDSDLGRVDPAHTRFIPLATQTASLFPHMAVRENVGYGIPARKQDRHAEIERTLSLFRIAHLANKLPHALSGGEAQRVNLARAAAATEDGGLLLLDEPFTGLDLALRSELMADLKDWAAKRSLCVLSVTHDVAESFQLDAEVIKLHEGRIAQQGPVATVLADDRARLLEQLSPA
jgi:molybdate transport system ATP-binding protein